MQHLQLGLPFLAVELTLDSDHADLVDGDGTTDGKVDHVNSHGLGVWLLHDSGPFIGWGLIIGRVKYAKT